MWRSVFLNIGIITNTKPQFLLFGPRLFEQNDITSNTVNFSVCTVPLRHSNGLRRTELYLYFLDIRILHFALWLILFSENLVFSEVFTVQARGVVEVQTHTCIIT